MRLKRAITLIEVVISLGLFSILIGSLFYFYHLFYSHKHTLQRTKEAVYEKRYGLMRLENILSHAKLPFFKSENEERLIFLFDRGVFEDPLLSGIVLGHLFFDKEQKALALGIWPFPTKEETLKDPSQTFVLLDNVDKVEFEFYHPPKADNKTVDPEKIKAFEPTMGWQDKWSADFKQLPAFVRIHIERLGEETWSLIDLGLPIYYVQEKIETS